MGRRAAGALLLALLLHGRLLGVIHGLRAYDGVSLPEDAETVTAGRAGWSNSDLSDDEDLLADEASGDGLGSGDVGSGDFQMVYFRALVNFTRSIHYSPQLEDASSQAFREVSEAVVDALESEYLKIPGDQIVSVVFIKELDGWVFVELDVGSEGNADGAQIQEVLRSVISRGSIASYATSPQGFQFRHLGTAQTPPPQLAPGAASVTPVPQISRVCTETEFACHSHNECVALEYRCDRRPDCRDMSDELNCEEPVPELRPTPPHPVEAAPITPWANISALVPETLTPHLVRPCGPHETSCRSGHCIPKDYVCDGQEDCKDGSDELDCGPTQPCEPNEFPCGSGHCVLKLWRCDGDSDCEDHTDEADCPAKHPEDVCAPTQFRCVSTNECIAASYHCDKESDCTDRSDEIGCMPPQVVTPPQELIQASRGQTVTFTCVAIGVPTPIINWRLNWGHIPSHPRVTVTSEGGRGTLIIRDVKEADQGAYTCEAMNAQGMVFGIPDGVLELIPQRGPCADGHFYLEHSASCLPCFCFGVTNVCQSSRRFRDQIRLRFDQPDDFKGVKVLMPSQPSMPPLSSTQLQIDTALQEFQLVDLSRRFLVHDSFWALPEQFLGNKVDSYGGSLRYKIRYELARGTLEPVQRPDVVLVGAGYRLLSRGHTPTQPGTLNQRQVQLSEEHWVHESGQPVQRAEMMQVLQSLEAVLIQTVYNDKMASVGLSDIAMDTTVTYATSHGRAHSVEECRCPVGYSGLSCESCDAHFTRVPGGPYLGTCSGCNCNGHATYCDPVYGHCLNCQHNTEGPQCNKCKAGFFGDATKGTATACRPCPCPYIDASRRFSDTCFLDTDGQATCDACAPGYTGRRCESCAPGYKGNPIQPGGKCKPTGQEIIRCDERGTLETSGEACRCKNNVVGRLCNECITGSFHLSARNPEGCLKCFCMGVSRQCTSSSWTRAQVHGSSEAPSQFSLTNAAGTHITSMGISSPSPGELVFSSFHSLLSGPHFWNLPSCFRGDKVTSYGGELRFTVTQQPQPGSLPLHRQPLVVLQGNGIVLEHHSSREPSPGQPTTFTVPFREQAWQRPDGQPATREHLLMALAGIDTLLIQASYSQQPAESRISGISMDVAVPEDTGQDTALEVEQCTCPTGYRGPSCQDCDTGYTRTPSGLYLGTCERCSCHGHTEVCEPETGDCQGCQHHTEGPRCEQCQPGYYGDAQQGTPHDCQPCPCHGPPSAGQATHTCFLDTDGHPTCDACSPGHSGRHCERCAPGFYGNPSQGQPCRRDGPMPEPIGCACDPQGSISSQCDAAGQCQCKARVQGPTCNHCQPHYFHLSASNPDGCLPCFCMGISQQCASSSYTRHLISTHFAPGDSQGFALVNPQRNSRLTGGFTVEPVPEGAQLSFGNFVQLGHESFYWQLPEAYQGDKVAAYGGKLRYTLSYTAGAQGSSLSDPDIQIMGNNIMLVASQPALQGSERKSYEIVFREEFWRRPDGQPATREHLLMALADLDELLIRATFSSVPLAASISGVSLEVAQPGPSRGPPALEVEECRCPPGYVGLSCQDCAPGYTRTGSGLYLGHCELCECNGHSDLCHPETGACSQCQHNAIGEFCELCAPGYYGDATAGTPEDCQPCACPLTNPENMFSRTCESQGAGGYRCTACEPGYTGQYCEQCAPGYVGNPNVRGGRCLPQADQAQLVVQVQPPRSIVPQGGPHSLRCQVSGSPPHYFYWSREDGRPLPSSTQQRHQGSELHFPSVQPSDSGVYICTCRNHHHANTSRGELLVTEAPSKPITVTVEEQRSQSVRPGADVTFICTAKSKSPAYTLVWTRLHNGKLPDRAMDFNGILTIRNVQPSDAGTYVCTGSNMFAMDQGTATLHVQASGTPSAPMVSIHPPQLTVQPGQMAEFRCSATGHPTPALEWTGGPGGQLPQKAQVHGGILRLPAVEPSDQAQYLCYARSSAGQHVARAVLHVHGGNGPRVQVSPERTQVHEGRTVRLYCRAAGVPSATITWRKEGGSLPPQARSEHTDIATLLIPAITAADAGFYLCVATSPAGTAQARIQVVVLPGASPLPVRIESSSSSVTEGQTLDLNCVVTGPPHAQIMWYKRGGGLPPHAQVHGSRLRLPQVSSADSGEYVCRVENGSDAKEASITISVLHGTHSGPSHPAGPAGSPARGSTQPIRIESSSSHVAEGQTLDLNCLVPGQAHAQVTWHRRGGSLPARHQTHGSLLRLNQVSPADSGEYVCRVVLGSGPLETSVLVTIKASDSSDGSLPAPGPVPPVRIESSSSTVAEGQTLDLNCVVAGQAHAQVTWYKRDGSLPARHQVRGSRLYIFQASPADAGEYVCRANNGVEASITVTVTGPQGANFAYPPVGTQPIRIESSSSHVAEGQTLDLNCLVPGQAHAQVTWHKRGGSLPARHQAHGSHLRLNQLSVADSGEYVCRANNNIDAREASITVSVSPSAGNPSAAAGAVPIKIESSSSHVAEGQTLDLNCVVPGQAHAQVTWHKRGGSLPTHHQAHGSRLRLYQLSPADSGEYICRVVSGSGSLEASIMVTVEGSGSSTVPGSAPGRVPPIRIETSSSHVAEGQTLDLKCVVPGHPHAQVTWHRRGNSLPAGHQVHGPLLRLNQVSPADSGEYSCQVTSGSDVLRTSVQVTIQASSPAPIPAPGLAQPIYIEASSSNVAEGETLDLNCVVPGQAHAQVTWFKRGGSLPARHQTHGSQLRLHDISAADAGEYVCRVVGGAGPEQEASFTVTVQPKAAGSSFRYNSPVISIDPPSSTVQQGQDASFKCLIHEGATPIRIEWKFRNQELEDNVRISPNGSIITIVGSRPSNHGAYRCVATNAYGVAQSVVNLSVHGPPTVSVLPEGPVRVKVGKAVALECVSAGEPRSSARWTRLGAPTHVEQRMFGFADSHTMLQISSAKPSDAGTYVCQAQNALGTAQKRVEVIVDTGDVTPGAPQVQVEEVELTVEAGHTATLRCSATGSPTPTIHWSKLRSPLPWQHRLEGHTLVIPGVAQQDSGQYICNASSPAGHAEATVLLHVESPPYATTVPEQAAVRAGEALQLQCLAHGTPPLTFQWSRVGGGLPGRVTARNEVLHFESVAPEDSGRYRCQVTNKVGSAEAFTVVLVQGTSDSLPATPSPEEATPTVQVTPQLETKSIGASVEFHCAVPNDQDTQLRWIKQGGQLPPGHSVQDGVLRIHNLDQSCQGTYVCQAYGPWGQAQASAQLVVQALPSVLINIRTSVHSVVVGHAVEFECLAMGDPKPQVTWSKVGGRLRPGIMQSGGIVRIAHVELADAGQYRCTATNAAGTTQSHVLLLVQALPQISTPPEVRVPAGSAAAFPCMASGYPTPDIKWSKLDGNLPPGSRVENNMLLLPSVRPQDAGTYVCTATNRQGKVKAFADLQVPERVVPYFTQTPHSFLPLPTIKDAYRKFEIKITFRPDSADGMLLYNGQKRIPGSRTNLANRLPDFISFGLVGGRPEFRFDAGSGMATIRHPTPLVLGQFHTVTLLRSLTQGSLIVGSLAPVNGSSQGKFQGLDLNEELYLGGYPDYGAIPKAGLSSGFIGCVRELQIQGEEIVFHDFNLTAHGISHCPTCRDQPCQNGGWCQDSESSSYLCICPAGFTGSRCEHSQALHCHPEACGPDATCVNRPDGRGYTCRCHLGRSGPRCEEGVTVTTPSMSGIGSYLVLPALTNTHHELRLDIEFKPLAPSGILLFSGGKREPVEDFVSLAMAGGHLEFRYELGSGLAVLRSAEPLALGRWHRVSAERLNKDGSLRVDGGRPVQRSSPGKSQGLNLHTLLYLGGVEPSVKLSPATNMSTPFQGCLGEVSVNGKRLDLTYSFLGSRGVGQCYDSSPCERQPCLNGATCFPAGEFEFQCLCRDGFKGDLCEHEVNPCQLREPCLHGGTCQGTHCLCPPGFSGPRCQQGPRHGTAESDWHLEGSGGNDAPGQYGAYFDDGGFLVLPSYVFPRSLPRVPETIQLEVRTSTASGLLLWQGMEAGDASHGKDFLSLGLQDGHLVFSYQLGSGEARLVSEDPVNDGEWHRVTALREGRRGSIQVDGEELVSGQSPGPNVAINTKSSIYVGGAPDVATLTGGRFSSGITGCLRNLVLHSAGPGAPPPQPLDLQHSTQAGAGTRPCPS
ncbi:basement membrane-specific heparan sulfate proteoglycan core protein isoform X10 [Pipistrellus kuhlii]|uniref:basement membrane-specific heparan sulfate proteoglycan core protein isoform X10 n=1 Tax=Pipistrellus kuhlii TaxID=59472 RepID=UPI001E26F3BC|nr:basement membrane-specific heparan sulfate proteoglycan core protein isoform X10 [Pipistrellus kuhlii]